MPRKAATRTKGEPPAAACQQLCKLPPVSVQLNIGSNRSVIAFTQRRHKTTLCLHSMLPILWLLSQQPCSRHASFLKPSLLPYNAPCLAAAVAACRTADLTLQCRYVCELCINMIMDCCLVACRTARPALRTCPCLLMKQPTLRRCIVCSANMYPCCVVVPCRTARQGLPTCPCLLARRSERR